MSNFVCPVCGSLIFGDGETAKANGFCSKCCIYVFKAKNIYVFNNSKLKSEYYSVKAKLLISLIAEKNFKTGFKKNFTDTILKQGTWLSKKQIEVCESILFDYDYTKRVRKIFNSRLDALQNEFWQSIKATPEIIECARQMYNEKH